MKKYDLPKPESALWIAQWTFFSKIVGDQNADAVFEY